MEQTDYYDILGVDKNATNKEIKEAFRDLALKHHPDRNRDNPSNADKMRELNEAYAVLSNDEKRREYDQLRNQYGRAAYGHFREQFSEQEIFRGADIASIFEEVSRTFSLRGFDDVFSQYDSYTIKSGDLKGKGFFSFISFGSISAHKMGGGKINGRKGRRSLSESIKNVSKRLIQGAGSSRLSQKGNDLYDEITIDPELANKGGAFAYYHKQKSKKLVVRIPKNIKEGQKIRLSKMGEGKNTYEFPGDLIIKVKFKKPFVEKIKGWVRLFSK